MFENRRKVSLHNIASVASYAFTFWTEFHQKCQKWSIWRVFKKTGAKIFFFRHLLLKTIKESTCSKIIVTHGTDTLIETARFLETNLMEGSSKAKICNLKVILTGSFLPEKFKDSDADFNLGMALGALGALQDDNVSHDEKSSQVLIALNGLLIPAYRASRNQEGMFMIKDQTIFT